MKHFYIRFFSTLVMAAGMALINQAHSQASTTVSPNGQCASLVQNFNTNSGGHSSPSIFGGMFDSAFYYNGTLGYWTEMDGGRTDFFLPNRSVSIISPPYSNPSPPGIFDVGFWYQTSSATNDRFQVRLVSVSPGPGGTTITNIVASSGVRRFSDFGTFAFKPSPANPANAGDTGKVCIRLIDSDITNGPNTFYRVEIAYIVTGTTYAAYDNLSIGPVITPGPLPVNFIGIVANKVDNGVLIRWDVADEVNVQEYQLEKSINGVSFVSVGTVPASRKTVYGFTDGNTKATEIFYRVKSVDRDGTIKYSGIIRFRQNSSYSNGIKLYPSPVQSLLTIEHSKLENGASVTLSTMDGRVLKVMKPANGTSNTMMNVSNLSSGVYVIKLDKGNGKIETSTFVKQ